MSSPFSDPDQRIAFFQQWFSDMIPHSKALGLKIVSVRRGFGSMRLDWREELVGNPETGVLAGGPLTALMDSCCGMSVATMLKDPAPFATLDLRIDYVRPATPGQAVIASPRAPSIRTRSRFSAGLRGSPPRPNSSSPSPASYAGFRAEPITTSDATCRGRTAALGSARRAPRSARR